jgi:Predicted transcriptional regulator
VSQSHTFISNALLLARELEVSRAMKRNRLEIIAEILQTAKDGAKKTRVMYNCNLSYRQTKKLLSHLLETGLLTIGNSYHTTEKGLQFLEAYHTLELLLNTRN